MAARKNPSNSNAVTEMATYFKSLKFNVVNIEVDKEDPTAISGKFDLKVTKNDLFSLGKPKEFIWVVFVGTEPTKGPVSMISLNNGNFSAGESFYPSPAQLLAVMQREISEAYQWAEKMNTGTQFAR